MTDKVHVNFYELTSAVLYPEAAYLGAPGMEGRQMDIVALIPAISFEEKVGAGMMTGTIDVVDSAGLLEGYPIRGEERLALTISDAIGNVRVWDLFVYKVDNIKVNYTSKMSTYTLHFITYQSFIAANKVITQAFKGKSISGVATEIFNMSYNPAGLPIPTVTLPRNDRGKNFSEVRKPFMVEGTDGFVRLLIPKMNTQGAMDFLVRRAYSSMSASCSFRFFESADAYFFVSDEWLLKRAAEEAREFNFTFADGFAKDGSDFFREINNLETLDNHHRVDTMDDIHGGAYRNRVLEIDTVKRHVNLKRPGYDYMQYRRRYYPNVNGDDIIDRHTPEFIGHYATDNNAKRFIVVKDFAETEDIGVHQLAGERHYKDIAENRLPFRKHLNSITVEAAGPPRLDITIGDVVNLEVLEISADTSGRTVKNPQLSGKYIITDLTRKLTRNEGRNHYIMVKMNWSQVRTRALPSIGDLTRRFGI